jgi:hypothetical protein
MFTPPSIVETAFIRCQESETLLNYSRGGRHGLINRLLRRRQSVPTQAFALLIQNVWPHVHR